VFAAVSAASGAGFHDVLDRWAAALSNQRADNCESPLAHRVASLSFLMDSSIFWPCLLLFLLPQALVFMTFWIAGLLH
jgi:hypothetical protein